MEKNTLYNDIYAMCRSVDLSDLTERDRQGHFSRDLWEKFGEFGLLGLPVEKKYGGSSLKFDRMTDAMEAMGKGCSDEGLLFAVNAHLLSVVMALIEYGNEGQKDRLLPRIANGELITAHAITESTMGSDTFNMTTTATTDGTGYLMNGSKEFITNAPVADLLLVYATTDPSKGFLGGITVFLLESDRPGITMIPTEKMGLRTCTMGSIIFDNVRVEKKDILLGKGAGYQIFMHSMDLERIGMSAMMVGIIDRLIENTITTVRQKELSQYQAVTHVVSNAKARLEAIRSLVRSAAKDLTEKSADMAITSSSVKLLASQLYVEFSTQALHIAGAEGYIAGNDIERSVRNAKASTLYSGTSEVLKNIIAKHLRLT